MGFWNKINDFKNKLESVENNIYSTRKDFYEVYEKNIQLEKEIKERTAELELANQRLVTVQHIWEMMNSSQPLANVLDSIVNSVQGELGYLYCCIIQKKSDNNGDYLKVLADSKCEFSNKLLEVTGKTIYDLRLQWFYNEEVDEHIKNNKIYQTQDTDSALERTFSEQYPIIKSIYDKSISSYILIPLKTNDTHFGTLIVLSSREEATEAEIKFLELFAKQIELAITIANLFQKVKEQAITDSLTGLSNRRYFEEEAQKELLRAQRQNQKFTIIGLDLDHLKQINDKYGHSCGDIAIQTVAEVLKKNARSIDIAARMGGEEFNLLLPGVDHKGGMIAAERIRKAIEEQKIDVIGQITASIGVATYKEHSDNLNELLELTDFAMYTSKKNGRNQVTLANPESIDSWQNIAKSAFLEIIKNKNIHIANDVIQELMKEFENNTNDNSGIYTLSDMFSLMYNPNCKEGSSKNKILLANLLAKRFELSKEDSDNLKIAILLYDIGNIQLPKDLLQKRTPLTEEEKSIIKTHPMIAAREILDPISQVHDVIPIIEHHHENWDGTGYPSQTIGKDIPICSQIVLIIDAYFALIEARPYRNAKSKEDALNIIQEETGKKWNTKLAKEFISILKTETNI